LNEYELWAILVDVKIGARGQEIEFRVVSESIVLKKAAKQLNLAEWKGRCGDAFAKLGHSSVDKFIDGVRGR
jgi:hypothetical protein